MNSKILYTIRAIMMTALSATMIMVLGSSQNIGETTIPPLGKFLDPFHGFMQNVSLKISDFKDVTLPVNSKVEIYYDSLQIPHIFAESDRDMAVAMGLVVAEQRLWQLDFQARAAAGRVSEIVGEKAIPFDRQMRRVGLNVGAVKTYESIKKSNRVHELLLAYTEGVNHYIENLDYKSYPIEYKLLDYSPEEWSPFRSVLILQYMVNSLLSMDTDFERTNLIKILGEEQYNLFFPLMEKGLEPVIPTEEPWQFNNIKTTPVDSAYYDGYNIKIPDSKLIESDPGIGSNNWVVSGTKTKSGNPIFANDPHLQLSFPSLWFMAHIKSPETDAMGFTFTGAPFIVIGFNDNIAWGFTNAPADQRDWYKINFVDESKEKYLFDGRELQVEKKVEEIKVKGAPTFYDTVNYTIHGPIVYDKTFNNGEGDLAFKWLGHEPSTTMHSFLGINKSKNYEEFDKAIALWDSPTQNAAFGSKDGDIALRISGKLPLKWKRQGEFILSGEKSEHLWQGFIPKKHNPFLYNPERGFVSSANQHSVDSLYPYFIYGSDFTEHYRGRRINRLLREGSDLTVEDMMSYQLDKYSIKAEETLPLLLQEVKSQSEEIKLLKEWDYHYQPEYSEPVLYEYWWKTTVNLLWDEFRRKDVKLMYPRGYTTAHLIRNGKLPEAFYDIKATDKKENWSDIVNLSWSKTLEKFKNEIPTWKQFNKPRVLHLTKLIEPFASDILDVGGAGHTLNAMNGSFGPSLRLVVELSDPPVAWGILPGGQSGNPGSIYYSNHLDKWVRGKYFRMDKSDSVLKNYQHKTIVNPK